MKSKVLLLIILVTSVILAFNQARADETKRPQLGVYLQDLDDKLRQKFEFKGDGVLVTDIVDDSGAEEAGIKSGDIIIKIDNKVVKSSDDLVSEIKTHKAGDKVQLKIFADGKDKTITVTLKEKSDIKVNLGNIPDIKKWLYIEQEKRPWIGIHMQDLSEQLADYFKVKDGILISEVEKGSPAEKAGLFAGDVITNFGDEKIEEISDLYDELEDREEGDKVNMMVMRQGKEKQVTIELGKMEESEDNVFHFSFDDHGMKLCPPSPPALPNNLKMEIYKDGMDEYKDNMEQLKKDMEKLKQELDELKKQKSQ